jgi:tetratricopeptide (TPR) repeat protein
VRTFLAALLLLLLLSSPAMAQCTAYTFHGTLIIPTRNYPPVIEVMLATHKGEQPIAYAYTDANNQFRFDNVQADRMDVVVRLEKFNELRESVDIGDTVSQAGTGACNQSGVFWLIPDEHAGEPLHGYPKEAVDEYALALKEDTARRYSEAAKHLEKVVMLVPEWFDAHCDLAAIYEKANRGGDAEKEYRKALDLEPDSFRAQLALGRLLLDQADLKLQQPSHPDLQPVLREARGLLAKAVNGNDKSAAAVHLLGDADFRLSDYKNAEIELKRALELDPTLYAARITLINVYISQKRWQDALDNVDIFLVENPSSPLRKEIMSTRTSIVHRLQNP